MFTALLIGCSTDSPPPDESVSRVGSTAHVHPTGETCFICDASKREPDRLWCTEHGRYEDRCWLCHPELRDTKRPYCEEHGLYQDECSLCDPSQGKEVRPVEAAAADVIGAKAQPSHVGHTHSETGQTCFICDASKREPGRLWCTEHGRYEDRCWLCHPELRDTKRPYCEEHGTYEDECPICSPSPSDAVAKTSPELFCNEHQVPERVCGICRPQALSSLPVGDALLIRLPSERSAELAGIAVSRPTKVDGVATVALLGEIRFDGNRLARVTPLAHGVVAEIGADVGDTVDEGDVLAVVNAPRVAEAKAAYVAARADLRKWRGASERQRRLVEEKVGARRKMEDATASHRRSQAAVRLARERLKNLGLTDADVAAVRDVRSQLLLRAPFRGTVVKRSAVLGEAVDTRSALFRIADMTEMWVDISVPEEDVVRVRVGTPIQVTVRAGHGAPVDGRVTWISPFVDERTRTVRARGLLPNGARMLRDGMFAEVTAITEELPSAVRLPVSAVQRVENQTFVFVQQEKDLFAARRVEIGGRAPPDGLLIRSGVQPEELVVISGGFVVKSALLASRLGAGCVDD